MRRYIEDVTRKKVDMEEIIRLIDGWLAERGSFASTDVVDLLLDIRSHALKSEPPTIEDYEAALAEIAA